MTASKETQDPSPLLETGADNSPSNPPHTSPAVEGSGGALVLGGLLSIVVSVMLLSVWIDNRSGFREAGAFADLLAAWFSSIATVWLIVAVFRQGEELRLQRAELALQRDQLREQAKETGRLADYNEDLAAFGKEQREIAAKQHIQSEAQSIVRNNCKSLREFVNEVEAALMFDTGTRLPHGGYSFQRSSFRLESDGARFVYTMIGGSEAEVTLSKSEMIRRCLPPSALKTMKELKKTAIAAGLGEWFEKRLPWMMEADHISPQTLAYLFGFWPEHIESGEDGQSVE